MNTDKQTRASQEEGPAGRYERPVIIDQGSLTELTLGAGSNFSDGMGPGGSGS